MFPSRLAHSVYTLSLRAAVARFEGPRERIACLGPVVQEYLCLFDLIFGREAFSLSANCRK